MSNAILGQLSHNWSSFWHGRSAQDRKVLIGCAVVVAAALGYLALVAPAVAGRAQLQRDIPNLRLDLAKMQALAGDVQKYATQTAPAITPISREMLEASLTQRGLTPATVALTSDFAKVQLTNVSFAAMLAWLDEMQKANRIGVIDANIVAQPVAGMVTATLSLKQQRLDQ